VAVIDHGHVLASGTIDELRESPGETLEDVFIRLVGASVAQVEVAADGSPDEEE
jgi:ABC-type multidrug transport system ATPase subunit